MKPLHWLPSEARIHYKTLCLTFKALNNIAQDYLSKAIIKNKLVQSPTSSDKGLLVVPKDQTSRYGSHAFAYAGPKPFVSLPTEIHLAPTYNTFKAKLKTHLLCVAYGT